MAATTTPRIPAADRTPDRRPADRPALTAGWNTGAGRPTWRWSLRREA